ncbi:MAG: hypothetical protein L0Y55_15110, partial [Anaerolineales bacterium]|nr:hypothetical protein [Anaerolineales bacterium]
DTGVGATDARAAPTSPPTPPPVGEGRGGAVTPTPTLPPTPLLAGEGQRGEVTSLLLGGGLLGGALLVTAGVVAFLALQKK